MSGDTRHLARMAASGVMPTEADLDARFAAGNVIASLGFCPVCRAELPGVLTIGEPHEAEVFLPTRGPLHVETCAYFRLSDVARGMLADALALELSDRRGLALELMRASQRPRDPADAVPRSQACQLGYHHQCPGENTLGTSRCKCDCHGGA